MADLNPWLIAAFVLSLGLIPFAVVIARKSLADGLAALQLAATLTAVAALLLAAGYHRPSVADIPAGLPGLALALTIAEGLSPINVRSWLIFALLVASNGIQAHAAARAELLGRRTEQEGTPASPARSPSFCLASSPPRNASLIRRPTSLACSTRDRSIGC